MGFCVILAIFRIWATYHLHIFYGLMNHLEHPNTWLKCSQIVRPNSASSIFQVWTRIFRLTRWDDPMILVEHPPPPELIKKWNTLWCNFMARTSKTKRAIKHLQHFGDMPLKLALSSMNLPLSSSSNTSRELLWGWLDVSNKLKNFWTCPFENLWVYEMRSFFGDANWCFGV